MFAARRTLPGGQVVQSGLNRRLVAGLSLDGQRLVPFITRRAIRRDAVEVIPLTIGIQRLEGDRHQRLVAEVHWVLSHRFAEAGVADYDDVDKRLQTIDDQFAGRCRGRGADHHDAPQIEGFGFVEKALDKAQLGMIVIGRCMGEYLTAVTAIHLIPTHQAGENGGGADAAAAVVPQVQNQFVDPL